MNQLYLFNVSYFDQVSWKGREFKAIANNKNQIGELLKAGGGTCSYNCIKDIDIERIKPVSPPFTFEGQEV